MKKKNSEPLYISVYKKMRDEIVGGAYKYGDKMPSKRVLADTNGVSIITVEHVYDLLCSEGYVISKQRSGYYCAFNKGDRFLSSFGKDEIPAESKKTEPHENGFSFNIYAKTARKVLSVYGESIFEKCDASGSMFLKGEIAAYLTRSRGMKVSPGQIIIGSGAELLYGIIIELLGKEKVYAAENPSYEMIEEVYKSKGVKYEKLSLIKSGIKSDELNKSGADVLHISPYRSYPSGVTADASKRNEYAQWASMGDRYIIEDDFESEFNITGRVYDTVYRISKKENVIYMNSFSKTVSNSVRTAYAVLPEHFAEMFAEKFKKYSCSVPTFEQYILASLIKSGDFERHINRTRRNIRKGIKSEKRNY